MRDFYILTQNRRSIYAIGNKEIVPAEKIESIISFCIKHIPSAFNSQSGRAVLLLNEHHHKLWQIVTDTLASQIPAEKFASTRRKLQGFASGYGTVLFFNDDAQTKLLMDEFPLYKDNFVPWALQSNGMLQFAVWALLEGEGLGASLQHYNPLIDAEVKKQWKIPKSWTLISQMPFGNVIEPAGEKEFEPIDKRFFSFR